MFFYINLNKHYTYNEYKTLNVTLKQSKYFYQVDLMIQHLKYHWEKESRT